MSPARATRLEPQRYLAGIEENSARLVEVLAQVDPGTPVPTCPEWTARDLLAHITDVHRYWANIVRDRITEPDDDQQDEADVADSGAPGECEVTAEESRQATAELLDALRETDPDTPCWSWAPEQTVGFTLRFQALEASLHRLDAELTAAPHGSTRTMLEPMLATDGVGDMLDLLTAATPDPAPGSTARGSGLLRVVASDTGTTWLVTVDADAAAVEVADTDPADGTVRPDAIYTATAEDLLCAFWKRPALTAPHGAGDPILIATFEQAVSRHIG